MGGACSFQAIEPVTSLDQLVTFVAQKRDNELSIARVVVDYEDCRHESVRHLKLRSPRAG